MRGVADDVAITDTESARLDRRSNPRQAGRRSVTTIVTHGPGTWLNVIELFQALLKACRFRADNVR
jgi:hypothetical protein